MHWLVEPLAGLKLLDDGVLVAETCSDGAVLNNCRWPKGLVSCDCNRGLVAKVETELV